jgi:hypothetical protein
MFAYVPFGTARPVASRTVTRTVATSPGTYDALSQVTETDAGVVEPTRTVTGADATFVVAVAEAPVPTVIVVVPAATPTSVNVALPAVIAAEVYEFEATVSTDEVAYRSPEPTTTPAASYATAVTAPTDAPVFEAGITELTTVATTDAMSPKKVTVSVERTVVPAEMVIVATPDVPSEKTPMVFCPAVPVIARPVGTIDATLAAVLIPRVPGPVIVAVKIVDEVRSVPAAFFEVTTIVPF